MKTARICCIVLLAAGLAASGGSAPQAQETPSTTAPTPAPSTPVSPTPALGDEAAFSPEPAAGERVSADNNISFPVDI